MSSFLDWIIEAPETRRLWWGLWKNTFTNAAPI
jgi:hypothetical protein